ncbi:MAG: hypothetical protein MR850_09320, partial [Bacteroidales bacterium]|nr:hypothetical protein [Bacteroidales bacterium]
GLIRTLSDNGLIVIVLSIFLVFNILKFVLTPAPCGVVGASARRLPQRVARQARRKAILHNMCQSAHPAKSFANLSPSPAPAG